LKAPISWVQGNLSAQIPGSIDGNQFESRVNGALQTIYDTGNRNPVVFSHGGTIMFWTMMNVTNLTLQQKFALFASAPLSNTNYVVVQGNPTDGWKLVNWNGQLFGTQPTPAQTIALQSHTLSEQIAGVTQSIQAAFATHNIATVLKAISAGAATTAFSVQKYLRAIAPAVQQQVNTAVTQVKTNLTNAVDQLKTNITNVLDRFKPAATTTPTTTPTTGAAVKAAATTTSTTGEKVATKPVAAAAASSAAATGSSNGSSSKGSSSSNNSKTGPTGHTSKKAAHAAAA